MNLEGEIRYDEDDDNGKDRNDGEMPTVRTSMGEEDARPPKGVSELQADQVGSAQSLDRGFVYFFETEDSQYVKIGFSVNVNSRMGQMKTLVPMRLLGYFPGSMATEKWLHEKFAGDRHMGEWFRSSVGLRNFIAALSLITSVPESEMQSRVHVVTKVGPSGHRAAMEMVRRRLKKLSPERRKEIAAAAAAARWKGHDAKRPASARKKAK